MRKFKILFGIAVLSAIVFSGCKNNTIDESNLNNPVVKETGTIKGEVISAKTEGIIVTLERTDGLRTDSVLRAISDPSRTVSEAVEPYLTTKTDKNGFFEFSNVEAGTYTVYARDAESEESDVEENVTVQNGIVTILKRILQLKSEGSVTGVLSIEGRDLNGLTVELYIPGTKYEATMNATDGSFLISGIPLGTYGLAADINGYSYILKNSDEIVINKNGDIVVLEDLKLDLSNSTSVPLIWLGSFASADEIQNPATNNAYFNTTDGRSYVYQGLEWVVLTELDSDDYVGEITSIKITTTSSSVTFEWVNPEDENFAGVSVYIEDTKYLDIDKSENTCTISNLELGKYIFTLKAKSKNKKGIVVETLNPVTKCVDIQDNPESGFVDHDYFGELTGLTYESDDSSVTFNWTNPVDTSFTGVSLYLGDVKYTDIDKAETTYCFSNLPLGEYVFTLVARGKHKDGEIIESKNSVTKKINIVNLSEFGYIGRGYNAITGEFFSTAGNGLKGRIIDLSGDFIPTVDKIDSSDTKYSAGTTITSYKEDWNVSVGVEAEFGGFSGSISSDFGGSSEFTENTAFATANGIYSKAKEYYTSKQIQSIKDHLNEEFVNAVNNYDLETLFNEYGTHVMLSTTVGGRFTMNYKFTNTSGLSKMNIKAAAQASYGSVSGSASTEVNKENSFSKENTEIIGYTRGGKSLKAITSVEEAKEVWDEWVESLEDSETWSLIDSVDTIKNESVTGIWNFAETQERKDEIYAAYIGALGNNTTALANMQKKEYIKSIGVFIDEGDDRNMSQVKDAIRASLGHDNFVLVGENAKVSHGISYFNLNRGAKFKNSTYLYYTKTTNPAEALKGVAAAGGDSSGISLNDRYPDLDQSLWEKCGSDFCSSVSKKWGYLWSSKVQNRDGQTGDNVPYLRDIVYYDGSDGVSSISEYTANNLTKYENNGVDIRKGCGGHDIFLYLYY